MNHPAPTVVEVNRSDSLPDGWQLAKLADVCDVDKQLVEPVSALAESLPYISLEHIESNTGRILRAPSEQVEDEGKSTTYLFDGRHVLYGKLRPYLNKVALPNFRGRCTTELIPLLPKGGAERDFLAWVLRRKETVDAAMSQKTGSRMPRADVDNLLTLRFPLPPPTEQRRLASILNKQMAAVARARAAAEAQLKAAKDLPAAFMRAVFDSPEAQQWTVKRLDEVCLDISDGTHFTPTYVPQGIPFLSVKDVKETGISFSSCRYITAEQHKDLCKRCMPEKGDVLYTKVGTTGIAKAIDVEREFSIFVSVALLKLKPNVLPEYVEKVLNSPLGKAQAADLTQGMANRNLVIRDIKRIEIPVPPLEMQEDIIRVLGEQITTSEQTREQLQDQLNAINNLPAALLREAFNGRL